MLALTNGGETSEVLTLAKYAKSLGLKVIAITGKLTSSLANMADFVINGSTDKEADTLGLAPTCSSTVALGIGDALAVACMKEKNFQRHNFGAFHPAGSLGRCLAKVDDFLRPLSTLPSVRSGGNFHEVLEAVTVNNFGVAAVSNHDGVIIGVVSDVDTRRALLEYGGDALKLTAKDLLNPNVRTIDPNTKVLEAISIMEMYKMTSLGVKAKDQTEYVALVRSQDLLAGKLI